MSGIKSRLESAEGRLRVLRPGLREIVVRGGLQDGVADHATIDGAPIVRQPDESSEQFRQRATAEAVASGARTLIIGGLPARSTGGGRE
jgi:uncharacterized Zn-binding protein involved in type VI secretion